MDKFCKFCGTQHSVAEYPKLCSACGQTTWINPTPVAVILQPVIDIRNDRRGILVGQRTVEPQFGKWGLVGGFIDCADKDVIDAALREYREETGLTPVDRSEVRYYWSYSDGRHLLVFVRSQRYIGVEELDQFVPNDECSAVRVAWEPEELCFISHTKALEMWFGDQPKTSEV